MNRIANRQVICEVLSEKAKENKDIYVLCSDSRGSASLSSFFENYPDQAIETGIAEQNLVSISAGLAKTGGRSFAASPASFLSTRSYEQIKVDVAYSNTNVKLIGISGGVSYGALGMSHHSAQDIAALTAIPNMRVYIPSDRFQTRKLMEKLVEDNKPAYVRVGRNPVTDTYSEEECPFEMDRATTAVNGADVEISENGSVIVNRYADVLIVACGEMVKPSVDAADILKKEDINVTVLDMYCLKPFDAESVIKVAKNAELTVTVEEHSVFGGLGAMVSQVISACCPQKVLNIALPDTHVITGTSDEVFAYYRMNAEGIADRIRDEIGKRK